MWMDWLSLFLRWFHVIAGVAWIGASFYFIWLDNNLETPPDWKKQKGIKGDLWAVHGGGFYEVAKYQYGPETIPKTLHWFKWEAYTTWISGFLLLILIYYFGASAYLIDPGVADLSAAQAIGLGLALIFGGLLVYEVACRSPLAKHPLAFAIAFVAFLSLLSWLSTQWFSGRGAYIHIGALIGTIMAANVLLQIIPSQKAMVAAVANKQDIDPSWGEKAKLRSVHNNYLTLPLLFIMISNHYPMTYQHELNWLVLIVISIVSAWIRHFFNLRHLGIVKPSILISGGIGMLVIALWVSMPADYFTKPSSEPEVETIALPMVTQKQVTDLMDKHCVSCHSSKPTDEMFRVAPLGLVFDTWQDIENKSIAIYRRTSVTKDMPFLNKSNMSEEERKVIENWYLQRIK
ncbi:urate hydroxylase PuuD [Aliiglaciecola sp. M165]|uniref:urate hydroxylase PuuD n=1 Tax=Aliiglaciecola sp. M165 TaxID=2593649 RepID=UPI00117CA3BE|nr:urate hydroxylase PuuD [Aliiglaciecola sp. M165]TRY30142.1 urate hydroxylase PuuD [Aliiglaciecola sp. M165]